MLRGRQVRASIVPSLLRSNEQLGFLARSMCCAGKMLYKPAKHGFADNKVEREQSNIG